MDLNNSQSLECRRIPYISTYVRVIRNKTQDRETNSKQNTVKKKYKVFLHLFQFISNKRVQFNLLT